MKSAIASQSYHEQGIAAFELCSGKEDHDFKLAMRTATQLPKQLCHTKISAVQLVEARCRSDALCTSRSYGIAKVEKLLSFDSLVVKMDLFLNSSSVLLYPELQGPPSADDPRLAADGVNENRSQIWRGWTACDKPVGFLAVACVLICYVMIVRSPKAVASSQPQSQKAKAPHSSEDMECKSILPERPPARGLSCSNDSSIDILSRDTEETCMNDGGASR